jgi:hypothetical protein
MSNQLDWHDTSMVFGFSSEIYSVYISAYARITIKLLKNIISGGSTQNRTVVNGLKIRGFTTKLWNPYYLVGAVGFEPTTSWL